MSGRKHYSARKIEGRAKKPKKISCYLSEQQANLWKKLKSTLNISTDSELLENLIINRYRDVIQNVVGNNQ